jgi:hypothetical protein
LAKTWLYEANGGCVGEELKAIKYFYKILVLAIRPLGAPITKTDGKY